MGHLKTINFPFGTKGKLKVLSVPIYGPLKNQNFYFHLGFPFKANGKLKVMGAPRLRCVRVSPENAGNKFYICKI